MEVRGDSSGFVCSLHHWKNKTRHWELLMQVPRGGRGSPFKERREGPSPHQGTTRQCSWTSPGDGRQRRGPPGRSVRFAGVSSLEVFILLRSWKVFDRMKGIFGLKVIQERSHGGDGISVPISHWGRWRGRPSRCPGRWGRRFASTQRL